MHRIKSIFISLATFIWLSILIYIIRYGIINQDWHIGALMSSSIPILFLAHLFILKPARTDASLTLLLTIVWAGVFDEMIWVKESNNAIIGMAMISALLWTIYTFWYSKFPNRSTKVLAVDSILPDLSFIDTNNNKVVLDANGDKKRVLLFYRGNWCPLCMAQVKEISKEYQELKEMGVEVALISAQPHSFSVKLAKKMNVDFLFLTDVDGKEAKKLEIFAKGGTPLGMEILGFTSDAVMPTLVITDEKNRILFLDQTDNYRVRPEPSTFISILKENS